MTRSESRDLARFRPWLLKWSLEPLGPPRHTSAGSLLPVQREGVKAMLKVATAQEERDGRETLAWWSGRGAAEVLAHDDEAYLMELAEGERSLTVMAKGGRDDRATAILCDVAAVLHGHDPADRPPRVVALEDWFRALWPVARRRGGILAQAATEARELLVTQRELAVLHGDLHHENVLDFGARGWLAIDPKGLYGERTFEFVNLLRNPDRETALEPGRFERQVEQIVTCAAVERRRLLRWTVAFTGLSAAWLIDDGEEPELDLAVMRLALAALAEG